MISERYLHMENLTSCSKSANKPSTSCVRTCLSQVKFRTTCKNLVDIIRLVARLFQQVRYSDDITILLQSCVVNLVIS
jgi:ArsR family metal-binding transcriptional regulator